MNDNRASGMELRMPVAFGYCTSTMPYSARLNNAEASPREAEDTRIAYVRRYVALYVFGLQNDAAWGWPQRGERCDDVERGD